MFRRTIAIILVLCLWNVFDTVEGQSSCGTSTGQCSKLVQIHYTCGPWNNQICVHYILVYYNCEVPCINGNWGQWGSWTDGACSVTCCVGTQTQTRTRECNDPPPSGGGMTCPGPDTETRTAPCGSIADQCALFCNSADVAATRRFPDTCVICVNRYYQCSSVGAPSEIFCTDQTPGTVWSQTLNACVVPSVCIAVGG